jgi:hypothetical protein
MPERPKQGSALTQKSNLSTTAINKFKVARKKNKDTVVKYSFNDHYRVISLDQNDLDYLLCGSILQI